MPPAAAAPHGSGRREPGLKSDAAPGSAHALATAATAAVPSPVRAVGRALGFDDVSIAYPLPNGGRYEAVAPVSLGVDDHEFVSIVGPTGCGKSTLVNVAAGLVAPSGGRIEVYGEELRGLNRRAGYLFQQDALMPWKTALDNVAVALEPMGVRRSDALEQARGLLAQVGLKAFAERYPHTLSGGQRKRVALAQTLIRDPKILLMDEPFGPLDAQTRLIMGNLLLDLWAKDRKAVLFITHDLEEAIALSDRVIVMSAGPAATLVGDFRIDLPRPRDIAEVRHEPGFLRLHREIWGRLRDEVRRAYGLGEGADMAGASA